MTQQPTARLLRFIAALLVCGVLVALAQAVYLKACAQGEVMAQVRWEIGQLYRDYVHDRRTPPARLEDLKPYAAKYPAGFAAIADEQWFVAWNTALSDNPRGNADRMIACRNKLASRPDWLIFGDGSTRMMSPGEYQQWTREMTTVREIAAMLLDFRNDKGRPPARIEDLRPYAARYPQGYEAAETGRWVVRWGVESATEPRENFERVLAYQKDLPAQQGANRGWAVMADGGGRKLTAAELQRALESR